MPSRIYSYCLTLVATVCLAMPIKAADKALVLSIEGDIAKPVRFTAESLRQQFEDDLKKFQFRIKDDEATYEVIPLLKIINHANPTINVSIKNHPLAFVLLVCAKDGYVLSIGLGELLPNYGAKEVYLAIASSNGSSHEEMPRLLVVGDKQFGRCTYAIEKIQIIDGLKLANRKE